MKKFFLIFLAAITILALTACGSSSEAPSDTSEPDANQESETTPAEEEKTYGIGDTWTVDGQWSFTIDSVEPTDERNEFEETDPAQVVVIHYNYENLGYEDKDGIMDGLFIEPYSAIDSDGNMCKTYPVEVEYAQETPVGAKCAASIAFGLIKEGSPVTIPIEMYDGNGKKQTAKYVLEF